MKWNTGSQRRYLRGTVGQMLAACAVAGALLLVFGSAGCSSSSSPSTDLAAGATDDTPEVPLIFTVRTDTAEGVRLIYEAFGLRLAPITHPDLVSIGEMNCGLYANFSMGLGSGLGHFAGVVAFNPRNPTAEAEIVCWLDMTFTKENLDQMAARMIPPRKVMRYDPATRTVTFGPSAMLPT